MDFENIEADVNMILDKHYTPGRGGNAIDKVIIHYNAANLSVKGCYDVWQTRPASAHYQVTSDGKIGQLVWDKNTAWHAGNWIANQTSIGVEHANIGDSVTDECIDAGSHLVAALCLAYDLGKPEWNVNVFGHNRFSSTDCPNPLDKGTTYHDEYMRKCEEWYDIMSDAKGKWNKNEDGWWYERPDGTYPENEWEEIDSEWFYFGSHGYMITGWYNPSDDIWYYLSGYGNMVVGWECVFGKWYHFDEETGRMDYGWIKSYGEWYFLTSNGSMRTGWMQYNDEWYYLSEEHDGKYGHMVKGVKSIDGKTYIFDDSGKMLKNIEINENGIVVKKR